MPKKNRVIIIAEAGVNHNGDISIALDLINAASNAGADIIKFQTFDTDNLVTHYSKKADYQIRNDKDSSHESQRDMLKKLELNQDEYKILAKRCKELNIEFLSTGFDLKSLNFLNSLGLKRNKIPSGEITNKPYLRHIAKFKNPILLSTGMSSLQEVKEAVAILIESGLRMDDLTILQCTSEYPTPMEEINLRVLDTLRNFFNVQVGISDHSVGISVPIASVALGAVVIEKHLTLDKKLPGPDHKASIEPKEFSLMVKAIREIELAMGDGKKIPSSSETKNKNIVRKSIVASRKINKGELFSYENIYFKRPGYGISPMKIDEVIGKISKKIFNEDELIDL